MAPQPLQRVIIDTDSYYESPIKPMLRLSDVITLNLQPGQQVIAYMPTDPDDEWFAVVRYDPSLPEGWQWWVDLEL
jgi:hypothetical protein